MKGDTVLVVDDDAALRRSLTTEIELSGLGVTAVATASDARRELATRPFDIALVDYRLPDGSGLDVLEFIRSRAPETAVIMMTAYSTVNAAVRAMKLGATDYATKPIDMRLLTGLVRGRAQRGERGADASSRIVAQRLIGESVVMEQLRRTVVKVAESPVSTVLLVGESGTGKDVAARTICDVSSRRGRPFVNITCSALPETLLESELFGHEAGAFTSATRQKKGLLEQADGGTVFLDEIGEMSPSLQAKLLRFLEERTFRRVGGNRDIRVDVRVIAATNRDLESEAEVGRFRRDLYYRLRVVTIEMPPLRARDRDVIRLARYFLDQFNRFFEKDIAGLSPAAERELCRASWPGNVRELKHCIEQAVLLCEEPHIRVTDLGPRSTEVRGADFRLPPGGIVLEELERSLVEQALQATGWNQVRAARLLGLNRDQVRYRIEKFGLARPAGQSPRW